MGLEQLRQLDNRLGFIVQGGVLLVLMLILFSQAQHRARLDRLEKAVAPVTSED